MKHTRLSMLFVASYLTFAGVGFLFAPGLTLKMLLSNRTYEEPFVRFSGLMMLVVAGLAYQAYNHGLEQVYTTTLALRGMICAGLVWLYFDTKDPAFLVILGIVLTGMTFTGISLWRDRQS